ncbi:MAG: ion transporter [Candidatus Competibacteraceae bacterium]|nr:ion transporter [Candidatus Competibacteraceae bacterium]
MSLYRNWRRRTWEILEQAHLGDHTSRVVDIILEVLIIANVLAVVLESVEALEAQYRELFRWFNLVSVLIFTVEYLLRLWCAPERYPDDARPNLPRLRWAVTPLALADLLAILPFYLSMFVVLDLRFLRLLRLLRVLKLARYSVAMKLLGDVFREEAGTFGTTLFILLVVMVLAASGIYVVEHQAQPEAFGSIPAAMWWAVATLTTVGYGDVTPITSLGKMFGACITIVGVGMVALPSGLLASAFSEQLRRRRETLQEKAQEILAHDRMTPSEQRELEELREELGFSREDATYILREAARNAPQGGKGRCPHCGESLTGSP